VNQDKELYVDAGPDGKWTAWTFRDSNLVQFTGNRRQHLTKSTMERIAQLTYSADKLSVQLLSPTNGHTIFVVSDWLIAVRKAAEQEPSPKAPTQGLCNDEVERLITDDECLALTVSIGLARGEEGFTIAEVLKIVEWAEGVRFADALLEAVIEGAVLVSVDKKGELIYLPGEDPDGIQ
jgi:hypothetical protein